MAHLGERLRQQRLARGADLSAVAAETRIGLRYLEAVEAGDWAKLPGAIYARGFVRQYASHVAMDPADFEEELQSIFQIEDNTPQIENLPPRRIAVEPMAEWASVRTALWERMWKPAASLTAVLLICSAVYLGWQRIVLSSSQERAAADPASNAPPTKLPTPTGTRPPVAVPASDETVSPGETGVTTVELAVPPGSGEGMAVRVVASQETWVSITANGKRLYSGVLRPNEQRVLSGVENAKMVIGNAGGVEVQTDGRSIGPIGPPGQVRVVLLSPEGPQIMRTTKAGEGSGETGLTES
jgi:cytoskeletal protein RodZ